MLGSSGCRQGQGQGQGSREAEGDGDQLAAVAAGPAAATGEADSDDDSEDASVTQEELEQLQQQSRLDAVEALAEFVSEHATADNLDGLWAALGPRLQLEQELAGPGDATRSGDLTPGACDSALQEQVARLHGVMQEAGRLLFNVARLQTRDVRRAHMLEAGHRVRRCALGTYHHPGSSKGVVETDRGTGSAKLRSAAGRAAANGASDSSRGGDSAASAANREPLGSGSAGGVGRSPAAGGGGSAAISAVAAGEAAKPVGGLAPVDAAPPSPGDGDAPAPQGGSNSSRGEGGRGDGGAGCNGTAAGVGLGGGGGEVAAAKTGTGAAAVALMAAAKVADAEEAAEVARADANKDLMAVADATARWVLGSVVLMLNQGLDVRDALYGIAGHKALVGIKHAVAGTHRGLRQHLLRPSDAAAAPGPQHQRPQPQPQLPDPTALFGDAVRLQQLPLLHSMAHRQVMLQLYKVLNSYCRSGWLALPATAAASAGAAAAPAGAWLLPPPQQQQQQQKRPQPAALPAAQLLALHARAALAVDLAASRQAIGRLVLAAGGEAAAEHNERLDTLVREHAAELLRSRVKDEFKWWARTPLLHQLVRAALSAELEAGRAKVAAARDAYSQAAAAARQAAAAAAAHAAAGKWEDAGKGASAGAAGSGPAAEAADAAAQALAQAAMALYKAEGTQHTPEVLLKLCDWQEGVRQTYQEEMQQGWQAARREAEAAAAASGLVGQGGAGGGGTGGGTDEEHSWIERLLRKRGSRPGGARGEQANGVGGSNADQSSDDDEDDSDDGESSDDDAGFLRLAARMDPLILGVEPGSFTKPVAVPGACEGPGQGGEILSGDGSCSTIIRLAALSASHRQGRRWWRDLWKTLLDEWPCGVVPCTWGSRSLYGPTQAAAAPAAAAPAAAAAAPAPAAACEAQHEGLQARPAAEGPAAGAAGDGEAGGEGAAAAAAAAGAAGGGGGGGGSAAAWADVDPKKRRSDAAKLLQHRTRELLYGLEESLPLAALGSYTLALLLRHVYQLQHHMRESQVLQPTAIRAPGRHAQEDPHTLHDGTEPCVVLSQLGSVSGFPLERKRRFVGDYQHAASPATAGIGGDGSSARAGSSQGAPSSGSVVAKAGGGKGTDGVGGGRQLQQQQQKQQQQPTKQLVDLIAELLEEAGYAQLVCKSCEEVAGAMLAISQLRQKRREALAAATASRHRGLVAQAAGAAAAEGLSRELGFIIYLPEGEASPFLSQELDPDDANFDLVGAGEMMILVLLLSDVDIAARRVTAVQSAKMAEFELELQREAAAGRGGARGAAGVRAVGRGGAARLMLVERR
ncbi:hypothetical protein HXX76_006443 [Chlamydomonas incerta]|uniref:Uncharacterized protein n=1 Tax=Chlamydomonas incerta TaxID=51695 RepID=A0A835TAT2_CHLIN|nr:hypothetical protein HXX76_006443 [Chlamydomonas incerta]|eukprot:KAG2436924.1 hypothetical protein HXX76_006443 [Chlamydomonas incerta]